MTIYVNVDSLNLGFPYFNFLGGYQWEKTPCMLLTVVCAVGLRLPGLTVISAWLIYPSPGILLLHSNHHHHQSKSFTSPKVIKFHNCDDNHHHPHFHHYHCLKSNCYLMQECLPRIIKLMWTLPITRCFRANLYSLPLTGVSLPW